MAVLLAAFCVNSVALAAPKMEEVAERAYLYGLQQAIYYGTRWAYTQNDAEDNIVYSGLNQLSWVRKQITPDYPVVTPNATTFMAPAFLTYAKGRSLSKCRKSLIAISVCRSWINMAFSG